MDNCFPEGHIPVDPMHIICLVGKTLIMIGMMFEREKLYFPPAFILFLE